jgi:hypothetical protein
MLNYYLLSIIFLCALSATAQELKNKFGEVYYTADLYKKDNQFVEGSPYLDVKFKPARINDLEATNLVRFDAVNHQVEIHVRGNSVMILDDSEPFTISLLDGSGNVYVNRKYRDENGEVKQSIFLRNRETDAFGLFEREQINFYKEVKAQGYQEHQPPQYKKERSTFYLLDKRGGNDILLELPTRSKKFVEHFPDRSKDVKDIIKEEKLDLYKAEDLIKVLEQYYGS